MSEGSRNLSDMTERTLSKSDFKAARTCDAKLYFREHHFPDNRASDHYLRLLARGGYMVEALAKAKYPDGVQLEYGRDVAADATRTMAELHKDSVTLFEPTVLAGRRYARLDILDKKGNVLRLVEVKSSTFNGPEHLASLADGKHGAFRSKKRPHGVLADWREYVEDVAFQALVLEEALATAGLGDLRVEPWLALLDETKRSTINDVFALFELARTGETLHTARYIGSREQYAGLDLITEVIVTDEVGLLREEVRTEAARLEGMLDADLTAFLTGLDRGTKCIACEFRHDPPAEQDGFVTCWGALAHPKPHALELFSIGTVKHDDGMPMAQALFGRGTTGLADIPIDRLVKANGEMGPQAQRQRRQIECTLRNQVHFDQSLGARIAELRGPLSFIDFEAARLALPYHAGMRGYGLLAFQWSCHAVNDTGASPTQREWLNTEDRWPNYEFAQTLRAAIGDEGPLLTWSGFESTTLRHIAAELAQCGHDAPELREWMLDVAGRRVVDMHRWCTDWYYRPGMRGRTSIKVVLDAIWRSDEVMRQQFEAWTGLRADAEADPYLALPPVVINGIQRNVQEGTAAVLAYEEMMYGANKRDAEQRRAWAALLRQYCGLDTLSMVLIFEHWRRLAAEGAEAA